MKKWKQLTKRGLALLLALVMCLGMVQLTAFATEEDGWTGAVAEEETPAEVQAFLDAVAALPDASEVTAENAAEIGEQVSAALDLYEAIGTETDEAAEALNTVYAVYAAVEAAVNLESSTLEAVTKTDNVTKTAYSQFNPNTNTSNTVSNGFAENGYGTVVLDDENPTATDVAFCHYWGAHISGWPNGFQMIAIERNTNPSVATAKARSTENGLVVDFTKGAGTGTTTIVVGFTVTTLRPTANIASSGQTYAGFSGYLYYTVTNSGSSGTVTPSEKPDKPTANDVPTANQNGYVYVKCVTYPNANPLYNSTRTHAGFMSLKNSANGWSFGEVYENDGRFGDEASASEYPWLCDLTLDKDWYLTQWNKNYSSKEGTHYLSDDEPVSMTFVSDGEEWYYFTEDVPLVVWTTHQAPATPTPPTPETIQVPVTIKVRFVGLDNGVFTGEHAHPDFDLTGASTNPKGAGYYYVGNAHGDEVESSSPYVPYVTFGPEDDFEEWTVEKGKEYNVHFDLGHYQVDGYNYVSANDVANATGVDFKFKADSATAQTLVITLVYEKVAAPTAPEKPTEKEVNKEVKGTARAAVVVDCYPDRHLPGYFDCYRDDNKDGVNEHPGRVVIGEVLGNDNDGYTCNVTFLAQKYLDGYNKLKSTTGEKAHVLCDKQGNDLTAEQANVTVTFQWNAETEKWELADGETAPVEFWTKCPDTTQKEQVTYKVQWIDADDSKVLKTEERTGTIGATVSVAEADKSYTGYTYVGDNDNRNVLSATLDNDKVVLKMYFTKDNTPLPEEKPDGPSIEDMQKVGIQTRCIIDEAHSAGANWYKLYGTPDETNPNYMRPWYDTWRTIGEVEEVDGVYQCVVTVHARPWADLRITSLSNSGVKPDHEFDLEKTGGEDIKVTFTLDQETNTWTADKDMVYIWIKEKPVDPSKPEKGSLELTKTVDNEAPEKGATVKYTITVTNSTNYDLDNMLIRDRMPENVTLVEGTGKATVNGEERDVSVTSGEVYTDWRVAGKIDDKAVVVLTFDATVSENAADNVGLKNIAKAFAKEYSDTAVAALLTDGMDNLVAAVSNEEFGSNEDSAVITPSDGIEAPDGYTDEFVSNADDATVTPVAPTTPPSTEPTSTPSQEPTASPSTEPSQEPTASPSTEPSQEPTASPSTEPSQEPNLPVVPEIPLEPSQEPSQEPSEPVESQEPSAPVESQEPDEDIENSEPPQGELPELPEESEEPDEDIDDGNPPQGELPEESQEPSVPVESEEPDEDIDDGNPPQGELPEESEEPDEDIDDGEPPMGDAPQTGDNLGVWLAVTAVSGAGLVGVIGATRKRKEGEEA